MIFFDKKLYLRALTIKKHKTMKKIYLVLIMLLVGSTTFAQRNIKLNMYVLKPAMDTNITTSSTQSPFYAIQNASSTVADSIAKGDTIFYYTPSTPSGYVSYITAPFTIKMDSVVYINGGSVPYASIVSLFNLSATTLVNAPFTSNTQYCWYIVLDTVKVGPSNPAIATVKATNDTGRVWINKGTDIKELIQKVALSTYPNPAVNELSFDYNFLNNSDATARISDVAGRAVLVKEFEKNYVGNQKFSLDISSLTTGVYFLEFVVGDTKSISKFNVQK